MAEKIAQLALNNNHSLIIYNRTLCLFRFQGRCHLAFHICFAKKTKQNQTKIHVNFIIKNCSRISDKKNLFA
jgi:hypothetical protein